VKDWAEAHNNGVNPREAADAAWAKQRKPNGGARANDRPTTLAQSSAEFVADFTPPDYSIEGLLQRRFVYSLTAATGMGKTAVALLMTAHISQRARLGKLEVAQGGVLYFAGENPDDVRMRWLATTQQMGLTPEDFDNVYFVPGVFKFSEIGQRIANEMAGRELALVIIDTSAAYFEGDDENSNTQTGAHARRIRQMVQLDGGPTVLVCCHPIKNAAPDNLLPRGGGAFLAEVDGNLTATKDDSVVEVHWQGKFRGPDFAPLAFQLRTVTHERLKDTKGRLIPTVVAQILTEEGLRDLMAHNRNGQDRVLLSIGDDPRLTQRDRAKALGWLMRNGDPYQMKVKRAEEALEEGRLITKARDGWELTERGRREVARLGAVSGMPGKHAD
jgi:hypothetical protein